MGHNPMEVEDIQRSRITLVDDLLPTVHRSLNKINRAKKNIFLQKDGLFCKYKEIDIKDHPPYFTFIKETHILL